MSSDESPFIHRRSISVTAIADALQRNQRAPVFVPTVHSIPTTDHTSFWLNAFEPRTICAPLHQGKTTELNYIRYLFRCLPSENGDGKREIHLDLQDRKNGVSLEEIQTLIAETLGTAPQADLSVSIASSLLLDGRTRVLFTIDSAERLATLARDWLLGSVEYLRAERRDLLKKKRCQIVVAGRFTAETLNANLEAATRSVYENTVKGFDESDVEQIARDLRTVRNVRLTSGFVKSIQEYTGGDKYLFQMLADRALDVARGRNGAARLTLTCQDLRAAIGEFTGAAFRQDRLFRPMLASLAVEPDAIEVVSAIRDGRPVGWGEVLPRVRSVLIDMAVVDTENGTRFRNRCVADVVGAALDRRRDCSAFLGEYFGNSDLLSHVQRKRRADVVSLLTRMAFRGELAWLYYAEMSARKGNTLRLFFMSLTGDEFEGELSSHHFLGPVPLIGEGLLAYGESTAAGPVARIWYHSSERAA